MYLVTYLLTRYTLASLPIWHYRNTYRFARYNFSHWLLYWFL